MKFTLIIIAVLVFIQSQKIDAGEYSNVAKDRVLKVTSYNVENFFDNKHDERKNDWTFLPADWPGKVDACEKMSSLRKKECLLTDWTEKKFRLKLQQIKLLFDLQGGIPDILAVQEVENKYVVEKIAAALGFQHFIIEEGSDPRGIDVALLYNENKVEYISHRTSAVFSKRPARDILGVYFRPKKGNTNNVLAIYNNHWPSQANPSDRRLVMARLLKEFMDSDRKHFGENNYHGLVTGDFNTIPRDYPHPFQSVLLNSELPNALMDIKRMKRQKMGENINTGAKKRNPFGTYFYPPKMAWNFLDYFFLTQNLNDGKGMEVQSRSFKIFTHEKITTTYTYTANKHPSYGTRITNIPLRYNFHASTPRNAGFSDHFPISVLIKLSR